MVHLTTTDMSLALLLGPQLQAFSAAGYEVVAMSAPGPFVAQVEQMGIKHIAVKHATRAMAPHRDLLAVLELRRRFKQLAPDIVHTHNPKPGIYGRIAARWAGVPAVVNTVHGLYAQPGDPLARRAVVYALERVAASCSDAELVQNAEDVTTLERLRIAPGRVHFLGNGVDLDRFDPDKVDPDAAESLRRDIGAGPDDIVVGVVGRLVKEKGYLEVFDAAKRLSTSSPAVRIVVAGPHEPDKADAISPSDVAAAERDGVVFLGLRDDMENLYAAMDLYVLASHREGMPRSAMEAAAMGVPVVASDIRGCRQVVDDGRTGRLFPPGDSARLTAAIAELAFDPGRRREMGDAARAKARRDFDDRTVIATTLDTYARLGIPATGVGRVRPASRADVAAVAALHAMSIPGLLSTLGQPFLRVLYRRVVRSPGAFLYVAELPQHGVVGFVAGADDSGAFMRAFVRRDGVRAAAAANVRGVAALKQVVETLRRGRATGERPAVPPAELLALAVAPEGRGIGLGGELVAACTAEFRRRGVRTAHVVTDANNATAIVTYEGAGFRRLGTRRDHSGETALVLGVELTERSEHQ